MQAHIGTLEHTQALNTYLIKYAVVEGGGEREKEKERKRSVGERVEKGKQRGWVEGRVYSGYQYGQP